MNIEREKLRKDGVHACVLRIFFFRFALLLSSLRNNHEALKTKRKQPDTNQTVLFCFVFYVFVRE